MECSCCSEHGPLYTVIMVKPEDYYFSKYYPEFYKVYSCNEEVSILFKDNIEKNNEKFNKVNYDEIYVLDSISDIVPEYPDRGKKICGMISIDNLDGTGHWVAFRGNRRQLEMFDSLGTNTCYKDQVTFILKRKFPQVCGVQLCLHHCGPQPMGGKDRIMKWVLENDKPLPPWEHSIITGYQSQHQFCYLEAFIWLIGRERRTYTMTPKENLEWIKSQARFLDPPSDFFYIYDPDKNMRHEVDPFKN